MLARGGVRVTFTVNDVLEEGGLTQEQFLEAAQRGLEDKKYNRIRDNGENFSYGWKFNLSQGAKAVLIDDKQLEKKIKEIALLTAKTINMKYGSVDIILTEDSKLFVLEINSGIMLDNYIEQFDGYDLAKDIYRTAIKISFED